MLLEILTELGHVVLWIALLIFGVVFPPAVVYFIIVLMKICCGLLFYHGSIYKILGLIGIIILIPALCYFVYQVFNIAVTVVSIILYCLFFTGERNKKIVSYDERGRKIDERYY